MKKHTAQGLSNRERRALLEIGKGRAVRAGLATRLRRMGLVRITDRLDDFRLPGTTMVTPIACGRLTPTGVLKAQGCKR